MLYQNEQDNASFYNEYIKNFSSSRNSQLSLLDSITNQNFPGAIIPTGKNYYICSNSEKDWSVLTTLVKSFVGISYSDFTGIKDEKHIGSEEEKFLLSKNILFTSLVSIPKDDSYQENAQKAFNSLYKTYTTSPNKSLEMSEYIDSILEKFVIALQIKDVDTAQNIISKIKAENRLDALNIKFMQIELAYSVSDWSAIVNDNMITHIINSRKPLKVRMHIIEAFYYEYLDELDENVVLQTYVNKVRSTILNLLFKCPENASFAVKKVYALAYLNNDIEVAELQKIREQVSKGIFEGEIQSKLTEKLASENFTESQSSNLEDDFIAVRAAVIDHNNTNTLESQQIVDKKAEKLDKNEQEELLVDNTIYQPTNWTEWLINLSDKNFKNSRIIAEQAVEEWCIDKFLQDVTDVKNISAIVESIEDEFAIQRFILSLPFLLESFKRSEHYPNPMFLQLYISILEVITIYEIKDINTLVISQDIVETILKMSPNEDRYIYILDMVDNIVEKANGKGFINWLLDFAEILVSENSSILSNRNKLLEKLFLKIYSYKEWLEEFHLKLIMKLAKNIGIEDLFQNISFEQYAEKENPWHRYTDKTIGIYTLSESAAKHAKEYLEEQIENVRIILNHDKAATTALRHVAEVSDYMVIVTQSAKHAATGEIQKIRRQKNREVLFPLGKGSSSIVSSLLKD